MVKTLTSLPQPLLEELDQIVRAEGRTRSDVVREAIELYLAVHRRPGASAQVRRAVATQDRLAQKTGGEASEWDGVAEIRKWRESR